jgi:hypothetical protein
MLGAMRLESDAVQTGTRSPTVRKGRTAPFFGAEHRAKEEAGKKRAVNKTLLPKQWRICKALHGVTS